MSTLGGICGIEANCTPWRKRFKSSRRWRRNCRANKNVDRLKSFVSQLRVTSDAVRSNWTIT